MKTHRSKISGTRASEFWSTFSNCGHSRSYDETLRARKVSALLSVLDRAAREAGIALAVEHLGAVDWDNLALIAGVNSPSERTVALLTEVVRARTGAAERLVSP